jgi:hypothetical protein
MLPKACTVQGGRGALYTAGGLRITPPYSFRVLVKYVANPLSFSGGSATTLATADLSFSASGTWQSFTLSSSATALAAGGALIFGVISSSAAFPTTYTYLLSGSLAATFTALLA